MGSQGDKPAQPAGCPRTRPDARRASGPGGTLRPGPPRRPGRHLEPEALRRLVHALQGRPLLLPRPRRRAPRPAAAGPAQGHGRGHEAAGQRGAGDARQRSPQVVQHHGRLPPTAAGRERRGSVRRRGGAEPRRRGGGGWGSARWPGGRPAGQGAGRNRRGQTRRRPRRALRVIPPQRGEAGAAGGGAARSPWPSSEARRSTHAASWPGRAPAPRSPTPQLPGDATQPEPPAGKATREDGAGRGEPD